MRRGGGAPATRHTLLRARRRLERVRRGAELLTRKRRALVLELFRLAAPAAEARARIGRQAETAYPALLRAVAPHGIHGVETLARPGREVEVRVRAAEVWGVAVAQVEERPPIRRSLPARGTTAAGAGPAAVVAAGEFELFAERLLDAAGREMQIRRLARALAATSRLVGTLERRVAPELEEEIRTIRTVLDERERSERLALKVLMRRRSPQRPGG